MRASNTVLLRVLPAVVVTAACFCREPTGGSLDTDVTRPRPLGVELTVESQSLPWNWDVPDAVTQASSIVSVLRLRVEAPPDSTDTIDSVIVVFGDAVDSSNVRAWLGRTYPAESIGNTHTLEHWYRLSTPDGICTTHVRATTLHGYMGADTVLVKVVSLTSPF